MMGSTRHHPLGKNFVAEGAGALTLTDSHKSMGVSEKLERTDQGGLSFKVRLARWKREGTIG